MDWKTAGVDLVKALAWPLLVLAVFWQLRSEIRLLLGRLVKITWKDAALDFVQGTEQVKTLVEAVPGRKVTMAMDAALVEAPKLDPSRLFDNELAAPRTLVEITWDWVRASLWAAAERRGIKPEGYIAPSQLARKLRLEVPLLTALDSLERLRNEVTHTPIPALTKTDAVLYRDAAEQFVAKL